MPDDEPTRLLPAVARPSHAEEKDKPAAERRRRVPTPPAENPLPPDGPDPLARVIVFSSIAVVGLIGMLAVFITTRDSAQQPTVTGQMVMPDPFASTAPAKPANDPASTTPITVTSAAQPARHLPASSATSRPPSPAAHPLSLTVGATVGLEVAGRPGIRVHYQQANVRVDQLSSTSSPADRAESRFVVRKGLGSGGCVSLEAAGNPDFYLRRFFADLVLHKRDGSPVFDQEATFCPEPTVDGKALVLVVRFPAGYVVVASPDGQLHLEPPDLTNRTAFVVRKPL